jgi:hypothetical protein
MNILFTIHHHFDPDSGADGSTLKLGQEDQKLGHSVSSYSFEFGLNVNFQLNCGAR